MEVTIKEEQTSVNEEHIYVNVNVVDNEDNTNSVEEIQMLNIRDRIVKLKYIDSDSDSKDLDTLLKELFGIFEELKEVKTIVECVIRDKSNVNVEEEQAVLSNIEDQISYIENTIEDVCSRRDDYEDNTTQLSISLGELREKVADFLSIIEAISNSEVSTNSSGEYEDHSNDGNLPNESSDVEASLQQTDSSEEFTFWGRLWIYCTLTITIVFSALDVGTDVSLMLQYFHSGQYVYGILTLVFVWVPALYNIHWLYYFICNRNKNTWLYQIKKKKWLLIILYIVPLASAVVAFNNCILLWKRKMNKTDNRDKTQHLLRLQLFDSHLEALPQLTLQLSIILSNVEQETQDTSFLNMLRFVSMAFSVFTVARVTYSFATCDSDNIGVKEAASGFTQTLLLIGSRVFVLSMGFTVSPTVTGMCLLLQWSVVAVAEYREYREEHDTMTETILDSAVATTISIFDYQWYYPGPVICKIAAVANIGSIIRSPDWTKRQPDSQ